MKKPAAGPNSALSLPAGKAFAVGKWARAYRWFGSGDGLQAKGGGSRREVGEDHPGGGGANIGPSFPKG